MQVRVLSVDIYVEKNDRRAFKMRLTNMCTGKWMMMETLSFRVFHKLCIDSYQSQEN